MLAWVVVSSAGLGAAVSADPGVVRRSETSVASFVNSGPSPVPWKALPVTKVEGLGDSVPAGTACHCAPYVALLAKALFASQGMTGTVSNDASAGLTSAGLLAQVEQGGISAPPGTVTLVTIGANDFNDQVVSSVGCRREDDLACYRPALSRLGANLARLLGRLTAAPDHGQVFVTNYWNVFLDGDVANAKGSEYVQDTDSLTRLVNAVLLRATRKSGNTYVDLYRPFKAYGPNERGLLAADGDHPSAAGHALIARLLQHALAQTR